MGKDRHFSEEANIVMIPAHNDYYKYKKKERGQEKQSVLIMFLAVFIL